VEFVYLDLGVNKISGGSDRIRIDATHADSHLALHDNRLSGKIPAQFRGLPSVHILEGNMFECSLDRNELPEADPSYAQYTCGSDSANQALALWAVCVTLLLGLATFYWYSEKRGGEGVQSSCFSIVIDFAWWSEFFGLTNYYMAIHPELPILFPRVAYFHRIYCHMRRLVVVVTMVVVFLYLPVYVAMHFTASPSGTSSWTDIYIEEYVSEMPQIVV
jgi:hypothetical protein